MSNTYDMLLVPVDRIDDIVPYDNQIIIKIAFPPLKTKSGILMTATAQARELASRIVGTVLKIGENVEFCKVGDEVIFAKYAGTVVAKQEESVPGADDGFEIRIIEEKQLVARLAQKTEAKGA